MPPTCTNQPPIHSALYCSGHRADSIRPNSVAQGEFRHTKAAWRMNTPQSDCPSIASSSRRQPLAETSASIARWLPPGFETFSKAQLPVETSGESERGGDVRQGTIARRERYRASPCPFDTRRLRTCVDRSPDEQMVNSLASIHTGIIPQASPEGSTISTVSGGRGGLPMRGQGGRGTPLRHIAPAASDLSAFASRHRCRNCRAMQDTTRGLTMPTGPCSEDVTLGSIIARRPRRTQGARSSFRKAGALFGSNSILSRTCAALANIRLDREASRRRGRRQSF